MRNLHFTGSYRGQALRSWRGESQWMYNGTICLDKVMTGYSCLLYLCINCHATSHCSWLYSLVRKKYRELCTSCPASAAMWGIFQSFLSVFKYLFSTNREALDWKSDKQQLFPATLQDKIEHNWRTFLNIPVNMSKYGEFQHFLGFTRNVSSSA